MRVKGCTALLLSLTLVTAWGGVAAAGDEATPIPTSGPVDAKVDVGGHELHVFCTGVGSPVVLIELGAGQPFVAWTETQDALATTNRTCVYERAGSGGSDPGPKPRTSQRIADELHTLLTRSGIPTPVVLVSHSIGGLHAQAFAQRHPDDVAALVFVDPRTAEYELAYTKVLTKAERKEDARATREMIADAPFGPEIAAVKKSAKAVERAGDVADIPLIVLTAGLAFPGQPQADIDLWRSTHEHLAAQSSLGRASVVEGARHEIFETHSDVIVAAVREVATA